MLPKVNFLARLTRDTELLYAQNGTAICKLGLACSEKYGEKETQLFIDAVAFGKTGEMLNKVQKGHRIFISGKIQTDQWQDNQGQKKSKISLVIESFEFVEKKSNNGQTNQAPQQGGYTQNQQQYTNNNQARGGYQAPSHTLPEMDELSQEIPF